MASKNTEHDHLPGDSLEQKLFFLQVCVELWKKFVEHRSQIPAAKSYFGDRFSESEYIDFSSQSESLLDTVSPEELEELKRQVFEFSFD